MKKIKKKNKTKTIYKLLLLAIALIGALAVFAVVQRMGAEGEFFGDLAENQLFGTVAVFLWVIPVLLILLIPAILIAGKGAGKKTGESEPAAEAMPDAHGAEQPAAQTKSQEPREKSETRGERFCMLSEIDRNKENYGHRSYDRGITLESFCEDFRNFAANRLKLYYDIEDIRRFVSGLAVSRLVILQGMSGTGKTSLAHAFGAFTDNPATVIPVQPMWKERTDLIGYYNEFTKRFNETLLLEKMYEANYSSDMYVTVLDEMNIARVEYYFAEFLSLLELPDPNERYIDVVSDKWENDPVQLRDGRLRLPENMWFIGTANNDDSTFAISDKVYDRAMILNLDSKCERFAAPPTESKPISSARFCALVEHAMREYGVSRRNMKRLEAFDQYLIDHFHITFGNRIMKQIREYIAVYVSCGGTEICALDDILSKKVIRKLETQNPIYLRNAAEGLLSFIDELFGADKMPLCKEYIRRLQRNA